MYNKLNSMQLYIQLHPTTSFPLEGAEFTITFKCCLVSFSGAWKQHTFYTSAAILTRTREYDMKHYASGVIISSAQSWSY